MISNSELRTPNSEILTGLHACALALSPNGRWLVVANAGSDTLSVIDTRTDKIVETICARQNPGDLFGAQPNALAFDKSGKTLFVCNGTQNAVAVFHFKPGESKLLGLIPVGWFPGAIAYDAQRQGNLRGQHQEHRAAKWKQREMGGQRLGFNTQQYNGSLSLVPVPSKKRTGGVTRKPRWPICAIRCWRRRSCRRAPDQPARPVPERVGEPSVFQHVIYIIKENRTYDQVLGDVTEGNGDADLCMFGERVTPNQHKLVRDFVLLDNTYCCGILSADGHQWTDTRHRDGLRGARVRRLAAQLSGGRLRRGRPGRAGLFAGGFHLGQRARARQNRCAISANSPPTTSTGKIRHAKANRIFSIVTTIS